MLFDGRTSEAAVTNPAQLVARDERSLDRRFRLNPGDFRGVREDGPRHPFRIAQRPQVLATLVGMVAQRRVPLVVEVVEQRDDAPLLFVGALLPGIAAHRRLDGQRVLAQALALGPLGQQLPCRLSRQGHGEKA